MRAGVCDGFIGNRILARYRQAADYLVEDGASPYEIDEAVRAFGYPMGPFQVSDLAGGDIGWATRKRKAATRDPRARYVQIADRICERGWFGQKTGRGWYLYPQGARTGAETPRCWPSSMPSASAPASSRAASPPRRSCAATWPPMVNEGANVVHEGIALRPLDVDVTFLYGYGFPRYRGGPMKYADTVGLDRILADIREFAQEDPLFWQALAAAGGTGRAGPQTSTASTAPPTEGTHGPELYPRGAGLPHRSAALPGEEVPPPLPAKGRNGPHLAKAHPEECHPSLTRRGWRPLPWPRE